MADDDQQVIRYMLQGLIQRDCEAPSPEQHARWLASPEGRAAVEAAEARREAFARGDLRLLSLTDRRGRGAGSFSLCYVDADRHQLLAYVCNGYTFQDDVLGWAMEIFA